jgi:glycosyltransferase involved in cell wall biosynthesis
MKKTDRIVLAGLANNKTSLGEVFRRYINCFKQFSSPDIYDIGQFTGNSEVKVDFYKSYEGKIDHDIKYIHSTFHLYNELMSVSLPKKKCCRHYSKDKKKIGYLVWESTELPTEYIGVLSDFDEVWTASKFCKDIFSQYVDSNHIKIINHPIPFPLKTYKKYEKMTILIMGNISSNIDRKNIMESIRVANIAKRKYPEIEIVFKTFTISAEERELISLIQREDDLFVIDEYYDEYQLQELMAKSHITLSMHRSEGFGLCLAEAIPFGTIPIATGYSGNVDFMLDSRLKIDYNLIDTHHHYFKGQWADPIVDDAVDKLCHAIENYGSIEYDFSNINDYSYVNVTEMIKNAL